MYITTSLTALVPPVANDGACGAIVQSSAIAPARADLLHSHAHIDRRIFFHMDAPIATTPEKYILSEFVDD